MQRIPGGMKKWEMRNKGGLRFDCKPSERSVRNCGDEKFDFSDWGDRAEERPVWRSIRQYRDSAIVPESV